MATGDTLDMAARIKRVMPSGWLPDVSPVADTLFQACGSIWTAIYSQIQSVIGQLRLITVSGSWLDFAAADFKGTRVLRKPSESDADFRARVLPIFPDKVTRGALIAAFKRITGNTPALVFEPSRPADCQGGYGISMGYGVYGRYGSITSPNQVWVQCARPLGQGVTNAAGYGSSYGAYGGGYSEYGSLVLAQPHITDADIYAAVDAVLPLGAICWVELTGANAAGGTAPLGTFVPGFNVLA